MIAWWYDGFGWCRFLGHRYDPSVGECLRCGGVPQDVADMLTGDDTAEREARPDRDRGPYRDDN